MLVFTTIAVIARVWSRAIAANLEFWYDDWAMVITLVSSSHYDTSFSRAPFMYVIHHHRYGHVLTLLSYSLIPS
jgi:hypothetical protein